MTIKKKVNTNNMAIRYVVAPLFLMVGCVSCGLSNTAEMEGIEIKVSRESIGEDAWPFEKIQEGIVKCDGNAAIFLTSDSQFSLNGIAKSKYDYPFAYEAGAVRKIPLSKEDPSLGTINADTEVLRKLCDK